MRPFDPTPLLPAVALALALVQPLAAHAAPTSYPTPDAAVDAVIAALDAKDRDALVAVFGKESEDVIFSGDTVQDRNNWREFLRSYNELHRIVPDGDASATLDIGRDLWPFPAPLVKDAAGWHFDAEAARDEVLLRRIGENELDVIDLMQRYGAAQAAYRAEDADGDGVHAFAASILSDPGKRDGLYWPDAPGAPESPIGDLMARAAAEGYNFDGTDESPEPYLGYYFRILTRQGPAAPGGAYDYMVAGHMLAGHALLAFPAAYGDSGVMTFMVGEDGVVYENDLGDGTLDKAAAIDSFDPGEGWKPVKDDD